MSAPDTDTIQGTIAGIPIAVDSIRYKTGRKTIVILHPGDAEADAKKGGRDIDAFIVEAATVGAEWRSNAESIVDAMNDGQVVIFSSIWGSFPVRHNGPLEPTTNLQRRKGETRFTLSLVRVPDELSFQELTIPPEAVIPPLSEVVDAFGLDQVSGISPSFADALAGALIDLLAGVNGAIAKLDALTGDGNLIKGLLQDLANKSAQLAATPSLLWNELKDIFRLMQSLVQRFIPPQTVQDKRTFTATAIARDIVDGAIVAGAEPEQADEATKAKVAAIRAFMAATAAAAFSAMAETLALVSPESSNDAGAAESVVNDVYNDVVSLPGSAGLYNNTALLRALLLFRLRNLAEVLPPAVTVELKKTTSAVLLAYQIYGAAARDQDLTIERRNSPLNPVRLPVYTILDVDAP